MILLFWITIGVFGLWLYVHEPADLPILGCAVAAGVYLITCVMIIKNAFQQSCFWGFATALVPAMLYVHAYQKFDSLRNETIVNLISLAVIAMTSLAVTA